MTAVPSFFAAAASAPEGSGHWALMSPGALPPAAVSEPSPHAVAASASAAPAQISFQFW
ncbi:hypothetical protein [Streptomyces sp. NPDC056244]|uniref:hypothetical protein n=1 Tax=Streptomyces sp. NPDC056244 TaxID=3345762 RepID=UPI0035DB76A2